MPREPLSTCVCATYIQGSEVTRFSFGATYIQGSEVTRFSFGTYLCDLGMTRCGAQILNILQYIYIYILRLTPGWKELQIVVLKAKAAEGAQSLVHCGRQSAQLVVAELYLFFCFIFCLSYRLCCYYWTALFIWCSRREVSADLLEHVQLADLRWDVYQAVEGSVEGAQAGEAAERWGQRAELVPRHRHRAEVG